MDLLWLVRTRIADSLDRLPRYMCTETIQRTVYEPDIQDRSAACDEGPRPPMHAASSDKLRLDVAISSTVEMYSWVGESRFNDRDLRDMVQEGAISNGVFAAFLAAIFRNGDSRFTYGVEKTQDDGTFVEFAFRVPYEKSTYRYSARGGKRVITGYEGTFLVDPESGDLVELIVRTSQLPAETLACYAATTLHYARVRVKDAGFLLPTESRLRIVQTDGGESENRTVFSGCHEFLGESNITFGPPPDAPALKTDRSPALDALIIPQGLRFRVALTQSIDVATAAAGDPVKAQLLTPIRDRTKVFVPAGAAVAARIVRVRHFYDNAAPISLHLKLETVDVGGVRVRLAAAPDIARGFAKTKKGSLQQRLDIGSLHGLEYHAAAFEFPNIQLIPSGLESMWVTSSPAPGDPGSMLPK